MNHTSRTVVFRVLSLAAVGLPAAFSSLLAVSTAWADDTRFEDWDSIGYTAFSEMQSLKTDGGYPQPDFAIPTHGENEYPGYKLLGIVLNNPGDMLDSTSNYIPSAEGTQWKMGGQWQVFVQTTDPANDFGGAALYIGQNYGNGPHHPFNGSGLTYAQATAYSYDKDAWEAEVARLSLDGTLKAGDIIEVRVRAGLFYKGKFNVNEQHFNDSYYDFDIVKIGEGDLPDPQGIAISDVRYEGANGAYKFDVDRLAGAEHYQAALVRFSDVQLADDASAWVSNATVTITDGNGYYFPLKLGLDGFDPSNAPTGTFDITGIFDQEPRSWNPNNGDPQTGYRLWTTDRDWVVVPEPGTIALLLAGGLAALLLRRRM